MFWRSVVGKLAVTILLLVSFVLFVLTIFLMEFFENFHIEKAENDLLQTASKVSEMAEQYNSDKFLFETTDRVKDASSRVAIIFGDGTIWVSKTSNDELPELQPGWIKNDDTLGKVIENNHEVQKQMTLPNNDSEVMIVGSPIGNGGAVYVYQSLDVVDQTKAETTKIILMAAGIAIILTTIFAFFLSTRITSPLIKMREAAFDLTRGEFNTKVPILTHDEIGELAMAFNRMGRQLKFHINALRQEKEQLSSIVSSMADGVITLNRNGDMIVTNPPAKRFIESWYYENNQKKADSSHYHLPDEINNVLKEVIQSEEPVIHEISIQGRNWVTIMTPLYDQTYVRGAVAVIRDMTEERRLDKLRKDFIANVSHELRTPISMLQGYSEAIVDDVAETKEDKNDLAKIINEESLRMGRLVNELLDIARMEAGQIQLNVEKVNINSYMNRIIKKFNGIAQERQININLRTDLEGIAILVDPDRMEQVFTNLIDNAIRHTNENGFVTIAATISNEELHVSIEDSGSGIPEEDIPFVFERFYKADKSRTRNKQKKGTGLGLAIAKNIIDAHQGTISVKSKLDKGTTFTFTIPLKNT